MPHMELWAIAGSSAVAGAALAHLFSRRHNMRRHMMMAMASAGAPEAHDEFANRLREWKARKRAWKESWKSHSMGPWGGHGCGGRRGRHWRDHGTFAPTGNRAFDEYRAAAIDRLEAEAKEFREFLDRLRQAKDKGEFDAFMAERKAAQDRDAQAKDEGPKG